jgi:phosphoserine phosphatase
VYTIGYTFFILIETLTAERSRALAQATASVHAEGLSVGADVETIMERWMRGEVSTAEMRRLVRDLYGAGRDR